MNQLEYAKNLAKDYSKVLVEIHARYNDETSITARKELKVLFDLKFEELITTSEVIARLEQLNEKGLL